MLRKRIIPCLDVAAGRVVKGTHFRDLRAQGDPVELARTYSQEGADEVVVVAIDARREAGVGWQVFTHGGRQPTDLEAVAWAKETERRGAGEILLTSIDADGTRSGYDIALTRAVADAVSIPVIASGGASHPQHLAEVLTDGHADAALAASIFHEGAFPIRETKQYLKEHGIPVR